MFENKKFQSNESGEVVAVVGDNGVFFNLSNGANIKKDVFFQKYAEMAPDVSNFFQQQSAAGLKSLAEQLKTVDSSRAMDGDFAPEVKYKQQSVSEQMEAPPEYRDMLLRKHQAEQASKDMSQYRVFENEDEAADDFERKLKQPAPQRPRPIQQPIYQQPQQQYTEPQQFQQPPPEPIVEHVHGQPQYLSKEEEAFRFFKGFKRAYPIKLAVDFDERIAEPNFIRMMVNNMEGDIIKFYTKEIMNRIYNDPGFLENKIYDKLRKLVFEEEQRVIKERKPRQPKAKKQPPKKKVTIPNVPKEERDNNG